MDRLGVPVFHAIRPWSRALSVHQGKGLTCERAMVGALMEAVESHAAESFGGERLRTLWADLPPEERPTAADDFSLRRGEALDGPLEWTPLVRWRDGGRLWAPWLHVSLDLTLNVSTRVERSSNGLAAAFSVEAATLGALCELLERDAMAEWMAGPSVRRAQDRLSGSDGLPASLRQLLIRCRDCGLRPFLFAFPSAIGWPTAVCQLEEPAAAALPRGLTYGSACRPTAPEAVEAAVLEAVQSRLTAIANVRDDLLPGPSPRTSANALAPPLPPGLEARTLQAFAETAPTGPTDLTGAVERLEQMGFGPMASVVLPAPSPAVVTKVVAPGLAMAGRRRRAAA